jgi:hypothetical protein
MIHISLPFGFPVRFDVVTAVSIRIWFAKDVRVYGCEVSTFQRNLHPLSLGSYTEDGGNTETMRYIPKGHNCSCLFCLLTPV